MKRFIQFINESVRDLNRELLDASEEGDLDKVKQCIETKTIGGYTPLNIASLFGKLEIVKYLVEKGVDIETKSKDDFTPLNNASYNGNFEIVKYLVEQGADIETKDKSGKTPLDYNKEDIWSDKELQEILIEQNPYNISILKKTE